MNKKKKKKKKKGNPIPFKALSRPGGPGGWGPRISKKTAQKGGKVFTPTFFPPPPPGNISGTHFCCGPGSSVGIATDYGLGGPGSKPGRDEIFRPSRPTLGPTQPPVKWVPGLSRG